MLTGCAAFRVAAEDVPTPDSRFVLIQGITQPSIKAFLMDADALLDDIQGIVLDAVGTLIEPRPAVAEAYAAAARRQGVDLRPEVVRERFRRHFGADEIDEQRGPLATDEATERRRWRRIVARCLPEVPDAEHAFEELWQHFAEPGSWRLYSDAEVALPLLERQGFALRIASNFDGRLRGVVRGLLGLSRWSDRVVISSEVGWRKPHEGFYRAVCESLDLAANQVLCVGDDRENDLDGPRRAGLRAVLVDRGQCQAGIAPRIGDLGVLARLAGIRD